MSIKILIDSREQAPFSSQGYEVDPEPAILPVGDYSLPGIEDRVAVDRKRLEDLMSCLMADNRDRFEKELARGRAYYLFCVVIESPLSRCIPRQISQRHEPSQRLRPAPLPGVWLASLGKDWQVNRTNMEERP